MNKKEIRKFYDELTERKIIYIVDKNKKIKLKRLTKKEMLMLEKDDRIIWILSSKNTTESYERLMNKYRHYTIKELLSNYEEIWNIIEGKWRFF